MQPYIPVYSKPLLESGISISPGSYFTFEDYNNELSNNYNYYFWLTLPSGLTFPQTLNFSINVYPYLPMYDAINNTIDYSFSLSYYDLGTKTITISSNVADQIDYNLGNPYYIFSFNFQFVRVKFYVYYNSGLSNININQIWREIT